jgi:hypothetical protein
MLDEAMGSIVRWALTFLAGWFVQRGIWSQADATQYVTAGSVALVTLGWSLWQKYAARVKLVMALSAHLPMSEETLEKRIEAGGVPSTTTPKDVVPIPAGV